MSESIYLVGLALVVFSVFRYWTNLVFVLRFCKISFLSLFNDYEEKNVVIEHSGNVGIITFPHHGRKYQIFFPYQRRLEHKMHNTDISLIKEDGSRQLLPLYPGFNMSFTAKECGGIGFEINDFDNDTIEVKDKLEL